MIAAVDSTQPVDQGPHSGAFLACATSSCLQLVDRAWLRLRVGAAGNRETSSVHGLRSARCPPDRPGWEPLGGDAVSERERNAHESVESAVPRRSARCAVGFASQSHTSRKRSRRATLSLLVWLTCLPHRPYRGQERDAGRIRTGPAARPTASLAPGSPSRSGPPEIARMKCIFAPGSGAS